MTMRLNTDNLSSELEILENTRLADSRQALSQLQQVNVLGTGGLAGAVAGSNREIAALMMARARGEGSSVAGTATRNALMSAGPAQGTGSAVGDLAAIRNSAQQGMQIAGRGAEMRAQESAQGMGASVELSAAQRAIDAARQQRQQYLALEIAQIQMRAQNADLARRANERNAQLGIDTQQYVNDIQSRDATLRTAIGGAATVLGTAYAATAGRGSTPAAPSGQVGHSNPSAQRPTGDLTNLQPGVPVTLPATGRMPGPLGVA